MMHKEPHKVETKGRERMGYETHFAGIREETVIAMHHPEMECRIGYPAWIGHGRRMPEIRIVAPAGSKAVLRWLRSGREEELIEVSAHAMSGEPLTVIPLEADAAVCGSFKVEVEVVSRDGWNLEDSHFYFTVLGTDEIPAGNSRAAFTDRGGRLAYVPDYRGNRLPDFSGAGYRGGGIGLPEVPVRVTIDPVCGDNTSHIQEAIDRISRLPADERGIRGAVLLKKGVYEIAGQLEIRTGGIVLRGEGQGDPCRLWYDPDRRQTLEELKKELAAQKTTVLVATGSERRRLLKLHGDERRVRLKQAETEIRIADSYVPVGVNTFRLEEPFAFREGDQVILTRTGNAEWIGEIGMDRIPPREDGGSITQWTPFDLEFELVVIRVEGHQVTLDSSLVNAVENRYGGGTLQKFDDPGRIGEVGVEHLRAIAYWQPNADGVDDTRHADGFVDLDYLKNAWVRNVTAEHFNGTNGAFRTGRGSKWVTIQDCSSLVADRKYYNGPGYDPTGRTFYETKVYVGRYGFYLIGQSALVQRCFALNNRHGFTLGSRVTGPNVFLDCIGEQPLTWSEPHHRWSIGGLYDNVHDLISLMNRLNMGSGHGWAGANYVAWNTEGTLVAHQPPTAQNWAIGHIGKKDPGGNRGPDAYWESHGRHVEPRSLYLQQLKDRLGVDAPRSIGAHET
ncbi:hypothetical protein O9H85_17645 [Paenibacillus filicis]|uniref:Pectate lyase n=1 Tax=Paenibacillus gyeongsangnamensis TaxID=3388067 RepID=A0ABT4QBF0_9BACL|nr:hypothetical protein [Paenibacillus filicis]MCZ8514219.1 hypothetical protein [Paenibacillus filicis]